MPKVSTGKLKSGMVVCSPVVDREGQVVVRSGESLTSQHVTLLKMWGIVEVEIVDTGEDLYIDLLYSQHSKTIVDDVLKLVEVKFTLHAEESQVSHTLKKLFINEELRRRNLL